MADRTERGSRGPAPQWQLGRTRTIRIPIAIADQLLEIARRIDRGEAVKSGVLLTQEDRQQLSKSAWAADCAC